jgi:hypothetical protein
LTSKGLTDRLFFVVWERNITARLSASLGMSSAEQAVQSVLVWNTDHGEEVDELEDESGDTDRMGVVVNEGRAKEEERRDEVDGD